MNNNIPTVDVHQLKKLLDNEHICLIDVRENQEWEEVHIPQAKHLPKGELNERIFDIAPNKEAPIYLHCRGGMRSITAAQNLMELGYKNVYSVTGGIADWERSGYEVKKSGAQ